MENDDTIKKIVKEFEELMGSEVTDATESELYGYECVRLKTVGKDWVVVKDEETAEKMAENYILEMLDNEPELFNEWFLMDHLDLDRIRKKLDESFDDSVYGEPVRCWFTEEEIRDVLNMDSDEDITGIEMNELKGSHLYERTKRDWINDIIDNIKTLKEYFGDDLWSYLDKERMVKSAICYDGWPHFLSTYDGKYGVTESGFVFWRE